MIKVRPGGMLLICNLCGALVQIQGIHPEDVIRNALLSSGWHSVGDSDHCSSCRVRLN